MPTLPGDSQAYRIRSFQREDAAACQALYAQGPIRGKKAPNDTGLDIDDIAKAYMSDPGSHFWVAQAADADVVGMIGVQAIDEHAGEIRRLRVAPNHRGRGIGIRLLETAAGFCRERSYLKVALDTYIEQDAALDLFENLGFRLSRTWTVGEKQVLQFYLDLYHRERLPDTSPEHL